MKKVLVLAFALCVVAGLTALVHGSAAAARPSWAAQPPQALKTIQGTVKADGDKIMFVTDDDKKSWDVMNPETLKAHAGHHVELSAHVYADKNQIHVMSVKMMGKGDSK